MKTRLFKSSELLKALEVKKPSHRLCVFLRSQQTLQSSLQAPVLGLPTPSRDPCAAPEVLQTAGARTADRAEEAG